MASSNRGQRWLLAFIVFAFAQVPASLAYTANKVWFEFLATGRYRVHVNYTVPELKEFRESYVEFLKKSEAESFYWDLVRGADFYPPLASGRRFIQQPLSPEPW